MWIVEWQCSWFANCLAQADIKVTLSASTTVPRKQDRALQRECERARWVRIKVFKENCCLLPSSPQPCGTREPLAAGICLAVPQWRNRRAGEGLRHVCTHSSTLGFAGGARAAAASGFGVTGTCRRHLLLLQPWVQAALNGE